VAAGDYQAAQKRYDELQKDQAKSKADLFGALLKSKDAQAIVAAQMKSKPSTFSEQLAALTSNDPAIREAARVAIGATRTGDVTPALVEKEWGDMKQIQRMELRRQGINTIEDYVRYRLGGGAVPGRAGAASNDPLGLRTP